MRNLFVILSRRRTVKDLKLHKSFLKPGFKLMPRILRSFGALRQPQDDKPRVTRMKGITMTRYVTNLILTLIAALALPITASAQGTRLNLDFPDLAAKAS